MSDPSEAIENVVDTAAKMPKNLSKDHFTNPVEMTKKIFAGSGQGSLKDRFFNKEDRKGLLVSTGLNAYTASSKELKREKEDAARFEAIATANTEAAAFEESQNVERQKAKKEAFNRQINLRRSTPGRPIFTSLDSSSSFIG